MRRCLNGKDLASLPHSHLAALAYLLWISCWSYPDSHRNHPHPGTHVICYWTVSSWNKIGLLKLGWKWGIIETLQDVYGSYSDLYWIYMDLQFKVEVKSLRLLMPGIAMEQRAWSIAWSQPWTGNKPTASRGASFTSGLLDAQGIGFPSFLLMFYELKICQHPMYPMFSLHQGWTCWFGSAAIIWFDEYYIYI
jgi:hypothetical protein